MKLCIYEISFVKIHIVFNFQKILLLFYRQSQIKMKPNFNEDLKQTFSNIKLFFQIKI